MTSAAPDRASLVSIDVVGGGQDRVSGVLRELSARIALLPPEVEALLGLGASLFEKAGPTGRRPIQLRAMPSFVGDALEPDRSHGDVLLQLGAGSAAEVERLRRYLLRGLHGLVVRWSVAGVRAENRVERGRGVTRNLFGFREGFGNPDPRERASDAAVRVPAGSGEPAWAVGGSYQVVRIIRFAMKFWDADPIGVQERVIGRRRDGRWLDGTPAHGRPNFNSDPSGQVTPLDAHVRRANPRTPGTQAPPLVRRGFSYQRGRDTYGQLDEGLAFICFQGDLRRGFEAVQQRLTGEALARYTLTVGGGYYFVPPHQHHHPRWAETLFGPA